MTDTPLYTRESAPELNNQAPFPEWRKKVTTRAKRIEGSFAVQTREGPLTCPDGYLAFDSQGWPYPIAKDEFEAIYDPA